MVDTYTHRQKDSDLQAVKTYLNRVPKLFHADSALYFLVHLQELRLPERFPPLSKEMDSVGYCQHLSRETADAVKAKLPPTLASFTAVQEATTYLELLDGIGAYLEEYMFPSDLCFGHMNPNAVRPCDYEPGPQILDRICAARARFFTPEHHVLHMVYTYFNQYGCGKLLRQQETNQRAISRQICAYALHRTPTAPLTVPSRADLSGEVAPEFLTLLRQLLLDIRCPPAHRRNDASSKNRNGNNSVPQTRPVSKDVKAHKPSSKQVVSTSVSQ